MAKGKYRVYDEDYLGQIVRGFEIVCTNKNISSQAVYDMAWRVAWELTEWRGADIGCIFWTKKAFDLLKLKIISKNNSEIRYERPTNKIMEERFKGKIVHEHIVPRKLFTDYIMSCKDSGQNPIKENFKKIILCIVTKDEDKILSNAFKSSFPEGISLDKIADPWKRYKDSNITEILEVTWKKDYIITKPFNTQG